ncbi:putative natural product biosynthesis protein, partial [Pseudomonas aeruginosa]|uniref:putative natural product biosynthesis protein n=1 Tax=Pseudomonas aeruginosa TaxID=287 RepID=UPI000E3208C8
MNSNRYPLPAQTGLVVAPGLPPKNSTLRPDQLNKRLSSAWHHLYDLCPELLKIDPPDGLTILRGFLQWAAEQKAAWNWAMHLRLYCWLLQSPFGAKVTDEHLEVLMDASAARWTVDDTSANRGILLASQGGAHITQDWKAPQAGAGTRVPLERLDLPALLKHAEAMENTALLAQE